MGVDTPLVVHFHKTWAHSSFWVTWYSMIELQNGPVSKCIS